MSNYGLVFLVLSLLLGPFVQGQQVASVESTLLMSEAFKPSVSVVWSPTGQAAWDQLRKHHHVSKVAVEQTSPTATALDDFLWDAEKTLPPGCLNVAGEYTDAFAADLRFKLTKLIGKQASAMIDPAPKLGPIKGTNPPLYRLQAAIMVSALVAKPRFPSAFEPDAKVQPFTHNNGKRSLVYGFGVKGSIAARKTDSVTVLSDDLHGAQVVELKLFTGDDGNPQRMILARDPRITSMEAGIEVMREARAKPVAKSRVVNDQGKAWTYTNNLNLLDQFWMPELQAAIMCDYGELIGKTYLRKDKGQTTESWWQISAAQQLINVKLNHSGVLVESVFKIPPAFLSISASDTEKPTKGASDAPPPPFPKRLVFDGPFLMSLWREKADLPYLAFWVDSADAMRGR